MKGFHVTTMKKCARYEASGWQILPPVRFWSTREAAEAWAKQTGRSIIVEVTTGDSEPVYPLPDHRRDDGVAYWTPHPQHVHTMTVRARDVAAFRAGVRR